MSDQTTKTAVANRHCDFYKATDGQWYMNYAPLEGEYHDSDTYGAFPSFKEALSYMTKHLQNPGGWAKDITGRKIPPKRAPNGRAVKHVFFLSPIEPKSKSKTASVPQQFGVGDHVNVNVRLVDRNTGRKYWKEVEHRILAVYAPAFAGSDWQYSVVGVTPSSTKTVTQKDLLLYNEPTKKPGKTSSGSDVYLQGGLGKHVRVLRQTRGYTVDPPPDPEDRDDRYGPMPVDLKAGREGVIEHFKGKGFSMRGGESFVFVRFDRWSLVEVDPNDLVMVGKTSALELAWGRSLYGAFRVRVPMVPADIDMQVRTIRKPPTPTKLPSFLVEGILRFKFGTGERAAVIVQFDVIMAETGPLIGTVTARGITGVQVSYALEPILKTILPQIVTHAKAEGILL